METNNSLSFDISDYTQYVTSDGIITEANALQLINALEGHIPALKAYKLKDHLLTSAKCAKLIGQKLGVDNAEICAVFGLVHDIGKAVPDDYLQTLLLKNKISQEALYTHDASKHAVAGYLFLKEIGASDFYASIALTHSFLLGDCNNVAAGEYNYLKDKEKDFVANYVQNYNYTIYHTIENVVDLMVAKTFMSMQQRLDDIEQRKGRHANTELNQKTAFKLKKELEEKIGTSIEKLVNELM